MSTATIRLSEAEKRMFAAAAKRRGISLSEFLREAAHREVRGNENPWRKFFAEHPAVAMEGPADLSSGEGFGG